ncbi:MAG: type II toxin-antitoxin system RelE/ParE family toxin [Bacteroidota bacterium]
MKDGLNTRFFKMLVNAIRALGKAPFLFQVRYKNIRQASIKKFPFWIHYLVDEDRQLVIFIAVLHSARDPRNWKDKMN